MGQKPLLLVVSGPSGSGKGTLCRALKEALPELKYSVSVTTRPPRRGEVHGVDYFFVSKEDFLRRLEAGEFLEWAEVYGNYYGTPRATVERWLEEGNDVLLELDVQGALKVKELFPQAVLVFIAPPSLEELGTRIAKRGTESEEDMRKRLSSAGLELEAAKHYDYVIVNDEAERALKELLEIIAREKEKLWKS